MFKGFPNSGLAAHGGGILGLWALFIGCFLHPGPSVAWQPEGGAFTSCVVQDSVRHRLEEALGVDLSSVAYPDTDVSPAAYRAYAEAAGLLSENRGEGAGRFVLTQEALGRVVARLQRALDAEPDFAAARYLLSLMDARGRRYGEAVANYRMAARRCPSISEGPLKDLFVRTVADYQTAARHIAQGTQYLSLGKCATAISEYRKAIRLMPDFAEGHTNLGLAYMLIGRYGKAVAEQQEAVRLKPGLAEAHYNLGNAYARQGRYAEAVAAYREAIRLKPDDAPPDSIVGEEYAGQGAYTEAAARHQVVMRHAGLANAYFRLGDRAAAVAEYEKILKIEPGFADAHYNLGVIYEAIGDLGKAIFHWQDYLRLAGQDSSQRAWIPEAKARLNRLERQRRR